MAVQTCIDKNACVAGGEPCHYGQLKEDPIK